MRAGGKRGGRTSPPLPILHVISWRRRATKHKCEMKAYVRPWVVVPPARPLPVPVSLSLMLVDVKKDPGKIWVQGSRDGDAWGVGAGGKNTALVGGRAAPPFGKDHRGQSLIFFLPNSLATVTHSIAMFTAKLRATQA